MFGFVHTSFPVYCAAELEGTNSACMLLTCMLPAQPITEKMQRTYVVTECRQNTFSLRLCTSALSRKHGMQACAGVEESGVADEATWRALLGDKFEPAAPPIDVSVSSIQNDCLHSVMVCWQLRSCGVALRDSDSALRLCSLASLCTCIQTYQAVDSREVQVP